MPPVDQNTIRKKIQVYLRDNDRDKDFIKKFNRGYCSGISSLWSYAKWLQTQPKLLKPTTHQEMITLGFKMLLN